MPPSLFLPLADRPPLPELSSSCEEGAPAVGDLFVKLWRISWGLRRLGLDPGAGAASGAAATAVAAPLRTTHEWSLVYEEPILTLRLRHVLSTSFAPQAG